MRKDSLGLLLMLFALTGCGSSKAYRKAFESHAEGYNRQNFEVDVETCLGAVERVLLGSNFSIDSVDEAQGMVQAIKFYQEGKSNTGVVFKIYLLADGESRTSVYANAIQTTEKLYKRSHTRFFLWIIPLPGGGGVEVDSVKTQEWTVDDRKFYQQFFDHLADELQQE